MDKETFYDFADREILRICDRFSSEDATAALAKVFDKEKAELTKVSYGKKSSQKQEMPDEIVLSTLSDIIVVPPVEILLEIEEIEGFPSNIDTTNMCTQLSESNCHYKVKNPEANADDN